MHQPECVPKEQLDVTNGQRHCEHQGRTCSLCLGAGVIMGEIMIAFKQGTKLLYLWYYSYVCTDSGPAKGTPNQLESCCHSPGKASEARRQSMLEPHLQHGGRPTLMVPDMSPKDPKARIVYYQQVQRFYNLRLAFKNPKCIHITFPKEYSKS